MFTDRLRVSRLKVSQREVLLVQVPEEVLTWPSEEQFVDILLHQSLREAIQSAQSPFTDSPAWEETTSTAYD